MKKNKSFSLVEVLIFVSILSVFFVAAASVTVVSLRNMKNSEHKIIATHYSEELIEWLRDQKEANWLTFSTKSGTYCFNDSPIDDWVAAGACSSYDLNSIYKREVVITPVTVASVVTQINIKITTSWTEAGSLIDYQVPLSTVFTRWEE